MSELRKRAFSAVKWDTSGNIILSVVNFLVSVFLARILLPDDFGLLAIGLAIIGISEVFINGGLGAAIIQEAITEERTLRTVFWFNISIGMLFAVMIIALNHLIASIFQLEKLRLVLIIISPIFLFNSLIVLPKTLLQRDLNFRPIVINEIVATTVGAIVGISLALQDFGYISLAAQHVTHSMVMMILFWYKPIWVPRFEFSFKEILRLSRFGKFIVFENVMFSILSRFDIFLIGKLFSPEILGLYNKSAGLQRQASSYAALSLRRVFFPVLSHVKNDDYSFSRIMLKSLKITGLFAFSLAGLLYVNAELIILGLFGPNWGKAVPFFRILTVSLPLWPLSSLYINGLLSKGYAEVNFWFGLVRKSIQIIALSLIYFIGINYYLWTTVIVGYFMLAVGLLLLVKFSKIPTSGIIHSLLGVCLTFLLLVVLGESLSDVGYRLWFFNMLFSVLFGIHLFLNRTLINELIHGFLKN